jgi:hypothetical protein
VSLLCNVALSTFFQALMVNEFHGLQGLQFNAKGAAEQIVISGDTWLVNFDVDVVNDSLIREKGAAALCVVVVVCLLGTFVSSKGPKGFLLEHMANRPVFRVSTAHWGSGYPHM